MSLTTPFHLALDVDGEGTHPDAWRRAAHEPRALLSGRRVLDVVRSAENAGFTLVTFEDALQSTAPGLPGRLDAVTRAAFVTGRTSRVGLAPVVQARAVEPFHAAAQIASLDHVSRGRGAVLVADDDQPGLAEALDRPVPTDPDARRAEVADVVGTLRALWDSWDDEAVVKDVAAGRYVSRDRLRYVDVETATFSVKGPLITPRPPQGQPVVLAAAGLLPPTAVDVALASGADLETAVTTAVAARAAGTPLALVELEVTLDTRTASAADRLADLGPDPRAGSRPRYSGSAAGLVDLLRSLVGTVDGVRLHATVLDEDLPVLSGLVVPALTLDRVSRPPRPATQLRTTLGLARPQNRYDLEEQSA